MLLNRQKLGKQPILTHYPGMSLKREDYYTPNDLMSGNQIHVYGKQLVIVDCDIFTKD